MISFKEFEDVYLKATYTNQDFEEGEVIAAFEKIQIAGLQEIIDVRAARGGMGNQARVFWETTKEIDLNFSQGVFSTDQFSLLTNSKKIQVESGSPIKITRIDKKESNEEGFFELDYLPEGRIFLFNKETGEKIQFVQNEKILQIETPYTEVIAQYEYNYDGGGSIVQIGKKYINGYLSLEGKTRIKDDQTGRVTTGIIKIPRLKIFSNLSMRLGQSVSPVVANFSAKGIPVGGRSGSYVSEFYFLNNDITADL